MPGQRRVGVLTGKDDDATWTNKQTGVKVSGAAGGQAFSVRAGTCLNCTGTEYTLQN